MARRSSPQKGKRQPARPVFDSIRKPGAPPGHPISHAKPEEVADAVYSGFKKKKDILYVKWFWKYIMLAITSVPETIFKKKKL